MTTETEAWSGFTSDANGTETKAIARTSLGQSYPKHYPGSESPLGAPLSIKDVARLIGCSAWTVRQKFIPLGLPHLRSGPSGPTDVLLEPGRRLGARTTTKERRKPQMSLYKRGKVYWSALYVDGVRHVRSLETTNRRQAEAREQAIRDELSARHFQLPEFRPEMTFEELYVRFLAEADVRPHHLDRAKHFLPFFAELRIGQITKNDAVRYRKYRHKEGNAP